MSNKYLPITITMQVAKDFEGKAMPSLTMRPPTTNDVIIAQQQATRVLPDGSKYIDEAESEAQLFANLTGTTREFIGALEFYDYSQLGKAYDCFLLPLPQYVGKCALLFPGSAEASPSESSEPSPSLNSTTG